jgi:hypothetical protein
MFSSTYIGTPKQFGSDLANPYMPVLLSDRPEDQGSLASRLQGDTMVNRYLLAPGSAGEETFARRSRSDAPHPWPGVFRSWSYIDDSHGGEYAPVVGPLVGSLVDRARGGDISGAVGEGPTYALAPRMARGVGGRAIAAARDIPGLREVVPSVEGIGVTIGKSRFGPAIERAANGPRRLCQQCRRARRSAYRAWMTRVDQLQYQARNHPDRLRCQ